MQRPNMQARPKPDTAVVFGVGELFRHCRFFEEGTVSIVAGPVIALLQRKLKEKSDGQRAAAGAVYTR